MPMPSALTLLIALAVPAPGGVAAPLRGDAASFEGDERAEVQRIATQSRRHATQPSTPPTEPKPDAPRVQPAIAPDPAPADSNPARLLDPVDRGWSFRIEPSFWYAAPRGDIILPGSIGPVTFPAGGGTFEVDDETDLNTLDADNPTDGFQGRAHFARDRWRYTFGGAILSTTGDATADTPGRLGDAFFAPGDAIDTEFDLAAFDATVAYTVFHGPHADDPHGDPSRFRFTFEVVGGARLESIDVEVDITPGAGERPADLGLTAGASEIFAQPIGGARLSMDLFDDLGIEVGVTMGYWSMSGHTSSTWDVLAAFTWRPIDNVGLELGYRYLGFSATADDNGSDFEYRGSAAGLFAGIIVQF
jgi:hypothetical protein